MRRNDWRAWEMCMLAVLLHAPLAAAQSVSDYPIPTSGGEPIDIVAGPDGNLWFTESKGARIGRFDPADPSHIDEFPLPRGAGNPYGIAVGADGNIWFAEYSAPGWIGQSDLEGGIVEFYAPSPSQDIAAGPDGNLWYTAPFNQKIGRMEVDGAVTEFPAGASFGTPLAITAGPDGNLWVASEGKVGKFSTAGELLQQFTLPTSGATPLGITLGPDGNLWVAETGVQKVARVTTGGVIDEFTVPTMFGRPNYIAPGPDGNLWFTIGGTLKIGRVTTSGVITEFSAPKFSQLLGITAGPDGNVWYVTGNGNSIGRVNLGATETPTGTPTPAPTTPPTRTSTVTASVTTTRTSTPRPLVVHLLNQLAITDTVVLIDDVRLLPSSGVLRIGTEFIAYDGIAAEPGSGPNAGRLLDVQRGADGSTATPHPPSSGVVLVRATPGCRGDCDGDRAVAEPDVMAGLAIALGVSEVSTCRSFDGDRDGTVTVDELVLAVVVKIEPDAAAALEVCPPATPTATATLSVTPTATATPSPPDTPTPTQTRTGTPTILPTVTATPTVTHTFRPLTCPDLDPAPFKSVCGEVSLQGATALAGGTLTVVVDSHCGDAQVTASYGVQQARVDGVAVEARVGRANLYNYFGSPRPQPIERAAYPYSYVVDVPAGQHTVELAIDPAAPRNCVRPDGAGPWVWLGGNVVGQPWSTPVPFIIEH